MAQGQFVGAPNWAHDILTTKAKGDPVDLDIISDTGNEVGSVSIIKGGPNTEASKAFVDWMLTKEAARSTSNSEPCLPGAWRAPAAGAPTLDTVKMVNYDGMSGFRKPDADHAAWQQTVGL